MKPTTTMMIATAALLAAAATGSAQSLKAEIPFAFQAGQGRMQPGTYQLRLTYGLSGTPVLQVLNYDDRTSIIALAQSVDRPTRKAANGSDAVLSFECTDGRCVLARIWDGSSTMYSFATGKPGAATRVATIVLRPDRGE